MSFELTPEVDPVAFIREWTAVRPVPLCPELKLHVADEATRLWEATENSLAASGLPPPFWAFAWPGGQALARWVLDHPERVQGKRVLDFGSGSGLVAVAAARAGAASVLAADIDRFAETAARLNAELNGVTVATTSEDLVGTAVDAEVIFAGDVCYERPMAEAVLAWLRPLVARRVQVYLADPGRAYLPRSGLELLEEYVVPTPLDLEDREQRETRVFRLMVQG